MDVQTAHATLTSLYERVRAVRPCSIETALRLAGEYDLDMSGLDPSVREQLNCYVSSLAWMGNPPVRPPPLAELLDERRPLLGPAASQAYGAYYEAMRAYLLAKQNYDGYGSWVRSFFFGPQPMAPEVKLFKRPTGRLDPAVLIVRKAMKHYLRALSYGEICVWAPTPPRPPPTVAELLLGSFDE